MRRRTWIAATGASILPIPFAVAAGAQAPALVRVGIPAGDAATPLLWAKDAGLFARAGLNLDATQLNASAAATTGVADGTLEIACADPLALVVAHERSEPFSVVAPAALYRSDHPDAALIVPRASTRSRGRDFSGRTIGVAMLGDLATLATHAWLDRDGAGTVQMREIPPAQLGAALDDGRIDGAPLAGPALALALGTGKYRVGGHPYDAIAARFVEAAYFARTDWILANRDLVDRFLGVIRQANAYAGTHENETLPLLAATVGSPAAALAGLARPVRAEDVAPAELQPVIALLARYQVIVKAFPAQQLIYPPALPPSLRPK